MNTLEEIISQDFIAHIAKTYFDVELKEIQYEVLNVLINEVKDMILIAKTGFGKSLTFQLMPLLFSPFRTALIIMPLNALLEEQCDKLSRIPGCQPFVLNGDSKNRTSIAAIRSGQFTHGEMNRCDSRISG